MVANVMCLQTPHVQTAQNIFLIYWKASSQFYLELTFGKILLINNWDMAQNVILQRPWLWKVKAIGQNK